MKKVKVEYVDIERLKMWKKIPGSTMRPLKNYHHRPARAFSFKYLLTPVVKDAGGLFFINKFFKKEGF